MLNWKKLSWVIMASVTLLCGCTQSNIVSPEGGTVAGDGRPDTEVNKDIAIDWTEVREDLRDTFLEPYGPYADYVMDLDSRFDSQTQTLNVLLPVTHKTTGDIAVSYAQEVLKVVGSSVATQNFYYEAPDTEEDSEDTYYGSFFDDYDVCVQVFFYDQEGEESTYLVNDTMKAGEQRALQAQLQ